MSSSSQNIGSNGAVTRNARYRPAMPAPPIMAVKAPKPVGRGAVLPRDRQPGVLLLHASRAPSPACSRSTRMARSTARPPSRSIRSPISTPGPTAPTSSPSRCSSRAITIRLRPASAPGVTHLRRPAELRRRNRNLRPVPLDLRLQRDLQHQGLHHGAAAQRLVRSRHGRQHREQLLRRRPSATSSPVCSSPSTCLTRATSTSRR